MRTLFISFGTRPEAIKMAPVVRELHRREHFRVVTCLTGQHREMLDQVVETFGLPVDHDLDLMRRTQSLTHITSAVLQGLEPLLESETPDMVLVHGDTTTTFATALAAFYQQIPVAHVEAGLRTDTLYNPYPEEANRRLTDRLTEVLLAPTPAARDGVARRRGRPDQDPRDRQHGHRRPGPGREHPSPRVGTGGRRGPRPAGAEDPGHGPPARELGHAHAVDRPRHPAGVRRAARHHLHLPHPPEPGGAGDLPRHSRARSEASSSPSPSRTGPSCI